MRNILTLGAIAAAMLVAATAAVAGTYTATANLSGASGVSLSLPADPSFGDTLDGTDQSVSYTPVVGVVDARGTGAGWNLTIASTAFDDGSGHTFAAGAVSSVAQACHSGSSCSTATTSGITYPVSLSTTAVKVFNATSGTGMGKVDLSPTIGVSVPGNAYAGTYTATVTLAVASGP